MNMYIVPDIYIHSQNPSSVAVIIAAGRVDQVFRGIILIPSKRYAMMRSLGVAAPRTQK